MTHPTDDELEAMAARLYSDGDAEPVHPLFYDAAAMLRACKGRQSLPRMTPATGEDIHEMRENGRSDPLWQHGDMHLMWVNEGDIANATFLAALDPAPDHSEWDAAIEAAAKEIDCGCDGSCMYPHVCPKEDVESIRALKKGQAND